MMQQRVLVLVLAASLACAQGCATYRVTIPDSDPKVKTYRGGPMQAYLWGIWYAPEVMAAECQGEGINDVVIKRNYLHDLASVLTLGIWMPVAIDFRCKAPRGDVGPFPAPPR
jgi:hypothetical protein